MEHAKHHVVVVGGGAAGSAAALALRQTAQAEGSTAPAVTVVGTEDRLPYNRTTVNKGLLAGAVDDAAITLPGMDGADIRWPTGTAAVAVVASDHSVLLADGSRVLADAVVLATGSRPRALPADVEPAAAGRVLSLRTADDTRRLLALLAAARASTGGGAPRIVVAGGGLIGTETAAVLLAAGCAVTLVDPAGRPLADRLGPTVAGWIAEQHRTAGVDVRTGAALTHVHSHGDGVLARLGDGSSVPAAAVVACLGVEPDTAWLAGSGVPLLPRRSGGGVPVDAAQRVLGRSWLYAAGDLAAVPDPDGRPRRVEHWGAALDQGRRAAAAVLADLALAGPAHPQPPALPGYSTYVHGAKLTVLGWGHGVVAERPVLGGPGDPRWAVALLDGADRVVGAVGVGGAKAVNGLRRLLERRAPASELHDQRDAPSAAAAVSGG